MDPESDLLPDFSLQAESGDVIARLKPKVDMFIDRSVAIYGPSGTGKTIITKYIMGMLNGHIDQVILISPTESSNRAYSGIVPAPFIHYDIHLPDPKNPKREDSKGAVRFLETIWARQDMMASIYTRATNQEALERLFRRIPAEDRREGRAVIEKMVSKRDDIIDRLKKRYSLEPGVCTDKIKAIKKLCQEALVKVFRKYILLHQEELLTAEGLNEDERYCLNYLEFNPRLLLIFDDCAAQLKSVFTKEVFRKLFYQGRHSYISVIFCFQDDTDLPANLRKSAFISFFTTEVVASSNFKRTANNFPKTVQNYVDRVLPGVFRGADPHRKLAYIREDSAGKNFYHFTFPYPQPFQFGSSALRELCNEVESKGTTMDKDNPYFDRFRV